MELFNCQTTGNIILEQRKTILNTLNEERYEGNSVEDWNICDLKIGEAIIGLPFSKPFKFQFELFH